MKTKKYAFGIVTMQDRNVNSLTVGYRRMLDMVHIAVSHCADDDEFKGKKGRKIVRERLENDENYISLPWGSEHADYIESEIERMFF